MKKEDIVFAPHNSTMWPGRITSIAVMADIKYYRLKQTLKVPPNKLLPFSSAYVNLFKSQNSDKLFRTAIKTAEAELKKRQRRESKEKKYDEWKDNTQIEGLEDIKVELKNEENNCIKDEDEGKDEMAIGREENKRVP